TFATLVTLMGMFFGPGQIGNAGERVWVRSSTLPTAILRFSRTGLASALQVAGVTAPANMPTARCRASLRLSPASAVSITEGEHMGISCENRSDIGAPRPERVVGPPI